MDDENEQSVLLQKTPLPWLTGGEIKSAVKLRPRGLLLISVLICLDDILMLLFVEPRHWHSLGWILFLLVERLIDFWIIGYLWKGRDWARVLIMIGSAISLFGVTLLHKETFTHQVFTIASVIFSAFMLYWFSTKSVVRFFKAPGNGVSNPRLE